VPLDEFDIFGVAALRHIHHGFSKFGAWLTLVLRAANEAGAALVATLARLGVATTTEAGTGRKPRDRDRLTLGTRIATWIDPSQLLARLCPRISTRDRVLTLLDKFGIVQPSTLAT